MSTARAATLLGPERLEIREYPLPEVADDGALLCVELGGVCGTDVKYFHGRIDMPYPVILGHEIFGRIERLGRAAGRIHGVAEGDRVVDSVRRLHGDDMAEPERWHRRRRPTARLR